jgi:pimeloyl-ACP methyl ester carboxylesterase
VGRGSRSECIESLTDENSIVSLVNGILVVSRLRRDIAARRFNVSAKNEGILEYAVAGPEDGTPIVFHHGTPGSQILFEPFIAAAVTRGLRYVSYTRPGYGGSTRQPDRIVASCVMDTTSVLNELEIDRCYVVGWSGGGPHALACAALLPQRVIAASTIAGVAPWGVKHLDWLADMGKENVEEFNAALAGPAELQSYLERVEPALAQVTSEQIIVALGDLVDDVDKAALSGELGTFLANNFREALRNGFWGWLDDDLAFTRDWGFELDRIKVPVTVWQGAKDRMVPFAHGKWLAEHVPNARANLLPEDGHLSLAVGSFAKILDDLIATGHH